MLHVYSPEVAVDDGGDDEEVEDGGELRPGDRHAFDDVLHYLRIVHHIQQHQAEELIPVEPPDLIIWIIRSFVRSFVR